MDLDQQLLAVGEQFDRTQAEMRGLAQREYGAGFFDGVLAVSTLLILGQIAAWFLA